MARISEILCWVAGTALNREPTADEIPTEAALAGWLEHGAVNDANAEALGFLCDAELQPLDAVWQSYEPSIDPVAGAAPGRVVTDQDGSIVRQRTAVLWIKEPPRLLVPDDPVDGRWTAATIGTVYAIWRNMPEYWGGECPIVPLVRAWLERPVEVAADKRRTAIMPGDLFDWVAGGAPAILESPRHDNELPIRPGLVKPDAELFLPGLEPPDSEIVPASALVVANEAGFGTLAPGRGARLDKRLLVYSLLAMPQSERRPGGRYTLRPTLRTLTHEWLWPAPAVTGTGDGRRSEWKPSRHARLLARAMNACTLAGVRVPGGEWRPVMFRKLPDFGDLDSRAAIEIALPEDADHGPLIHRDALIAAGVVSDPAFDGSLTLATLWDRAKAANGGFRIYATRPKALRDPQGRLTRADGSLILGHGSNPFTARDGRLQWRTGEVPQRDWRHPAAVILGEERHPQADKVPILDRNERRRLLYGHGSDQLDRRARSKAADRADSRLRQLEAEGRIVIEDCGRDGWRILEPRP